MLIFLLDFAAERYVEVKYGFAHDVDDVDELVTRSGQSHSNGHTHEGVSHQFLHSGDQDDEITAIPPSTPDSGNSEPKSEKSSIGISEAAAQERSFQQQIAAFLILEFGVIVHSVVIGLNLGVVGKEFSTLYPVLVFHQSFEGLGIGARMIAIPFPKRVKWMPWALCAAYGLTTPIAIACGLGVRNTYSSGSFTSNIVSGVLDSVSAGILLYTGLVELLARDFLFNPNRTKDNARLCFMLLSLYAGCALMALLGKWA